jgi:hypothetical protein
MFQDLSKCNNIGGIAEILFCLRGLIGEDGKDLIEIHTLNQHSGAESIQTLNELLTFLETYRILFRNSSGLLKIGSKFIPFLFSNEQLVNCIIKNVLELSFERNELNSVHFSYNHQIDAIVFNNNQFSVKYAYLRNFLLSVNVLTLLKDTLGDHIVVVRDYEQFIQKLNSRASVRLTQQQLLSKLELNRIAGEKAEVFVFGWEHGRIKCRKARNLIRKISDIDVAAGYDIVSVNSDASTVADRFIEVKAVGKDFKFYWSRNEIDVARTLGEQYYLYLVELEQIEKSGYSPYIINNPAHHIFHSESWYSIPDSYLVKRLEV